MEVTLECSYCGHKWRDKIYSIAMIPKCIKCADRKVKVRKDDGDKKDYYAGSPPFPKKEDDEKISYPILEDFNYYD